MMDTKNIIIVCLVILIVVLAAAVGFLIGQQGSAHDVTNVTNVTNAAQENNTVNNATSVDEDAGTYDSANYNQQEEIDYNSPDSEYYKWDTDGSYHKKQEGVNYIYAQDAVTGEWSYWADKS